MEDADGHSDGGTDVTDNLTQIRAFLARIKLDHEFYEKSRAPPIDEMMKHCIDSLCCLRYLVVMEDREFYLNRASSTLEDSPPSHLSSYDPELQAALRLTFSGAIVRILSQLVPATMMAEPDMAGYLVDTFPNEDGAKGWLPLHWVALLSETTPFNAMLHSSFPPRAYDINELQYDRAVRELGDVPDEEGEDEDEGNDEDEDGDDDGDGNNDGDGDGDNGSWGTVTEDDEEEQGVLGDDLAATEDDDMPLTSRTGGDDAAPAAGGGVSPRGDTGTFYGLGLGPQYPHPHLPLPLSSLRRASAATTGNNAAATATADATAATGYGIAGFGASAGASAGAGGGYGYASGSMTARAAAGGGYYGGHYLGSATTGAATAIGSPRAGYNPTSSMPSSATAPRDLKGGGGGGGIVPLPPVVVAPAAAAAAAVSDAPPAAPSAPAVPLVRVPRLPLERLPYYVSLMFAVEGNEEDLISYELPVPAPVPAPATVSVTVVSPVTAVPSQLGVTGTDTTTAPFTSSAEASIRKSLSNSNSNVTAADQPVSAFDVAAAEFGYSCSEQRSQLNVAGEDAINDATSALALPAATATATESNSTTTTAAGPDTVSATTTVGATANNTNTISSGAEGIDITAACKEEDDREAVPMSMLGAVSRLLGGPVFAATVRGTEEGGTDPNTSNYIVSATTNSAPVVSASSHSDGTAAVRAASTTGGTTSITTSASDGTTLAVLRLLLRCSRIRRGIRDTDMGGHTALHYAACYATTEGVRLLLDADQEEQEEVDEVEGGDEEEAVGTIAAMVSDSQTLALHLGNQ
jgi:hypothetical protein